MSRSIALISKMRPGRLEALIFVTLFLIGWHVDAQAAKALKPKKAPAPATETLSRDWVLIHSSHEFSVHLDETSRRVTRDGLRAWKVWDYKIPKEVDGRPFRSEKVQTDYDCKTHKIREMIWVTYTGPHGHGEVVSAEPLMQDWKTPDPETISELEWQYLCGDSAPSNKAESTERSKSHAPKPPKATSKGE